MLLKCNPPGKLDNRFGSNEVILHDLRAARSQSRVLKVVNDKFVYVAGGISNTYYLDGLYMKYDIQGRLLKK